MAMMIIPGETVGIHYEIDTALEPIGVGGMGQVMKGVQVDTRTGVRRPAAIKFLFSDLPESAIERARREASVRIRNENLVEMFGFITVDETTAQGQTVHHYHVASELLDGVVLSDLLNGKLTNPKGEALPYAEELYVQLKQRPDRFAVTVIKSVLSGLMALHDSGYIHRDIDPSNIMVTSDRKIKLIDFGIAKELQTLNTQDRQLTTAGQFMGKAAYAAPELALGDIAHQNETTDIYAVGIMLFQLIAGHLPFDGPTNLVLDKQVREPLPLSAIADKKMRKVIARATEKDPAKRFASASEFRVAVEKLEKELSAALVQEPGKKKPSAKQVKQLSYAGGALVLLALLVFGGVSLRNGMQQKRAEKQFLVQEQERMLDARKRVLQDSIINTAQQTQFRDSLTGLTVKSAGQLISEAVELLRSGEAKEAVPKLLLVGEKRYPVSARAYSILGAWYADGLLCRSLDFAPSDTLDYQKAHQYNELAVVLDASCYPALYELMLDSIKPARGIVSTPDGNTFKSLSKECLKYAKAANDTLFVQAIE